MGSEHVPVWFITGCSSGFGRALATLVLERGWRAAVTARDASQVAGLVARHDGRGLALALDVTNPAQIAAAVHAAEGRFGSIDVLVNNAGYGYQSTVEEGEDAAVRALFEANVFGLAAMTRAVLPGMRARGRGQLAVVASVAGYRGLPQAAAYGPTKAALINLAETLRLELRGSGVDLRLVNPGFVATRLTAQNRFAMPSILTPEDAARRILAGLKGSGFEIAFPFGFATWMKLLRLLPYRLYFPLVARITGLGH